MKDFLDLHTHTTASGHAYNSLYEMVRAAADRKLELFGCSDHAPQMPGSCHWFHFINFRVIPRRLFGTRVIMGAELNILDFEGHVDLTQDVLGKLDYAIASLHPPCIKAGTAEENTKAYLNAMKNRLIHIIGHPDDGRYPVDYETLVLGAKKYHKLLEINNSSLHPGSFRPGARENYTRMLTLCKEHQVPVIMGSDAHIAEDVGNHAFATALLEELDFPEELVANSNLDLLAEYLPKLKKLLKEEELHD